MICIACNQDKDLSGFYFRSDTGKYKNTCKECCISGKKKVKSETHKKCKHCGINKPFDEFQKAGGGKWLQPYCKSCDSERKKQWEIENGEHVKNKRKEYYLATRVLVDPKQKEINKKIVIDKLRAGAIKYIESMPKLSAEEKKNRKSERDKKYREKYKDKVIENKRKYQESGRAAEMAKKWQAKQMNNIEFRTKKRLRGRIYVALKRGVKSQGTMELLGCTIEQFKKHFQSLFTEGMSWDKYMKGEIVIDHKIPCASFDLSVPDQQKKCFHYSNLQPLWELDNLKKGAKILDYGNC